AVRHRRRIQQPWSLLLQVLSVALLLLAISQLRLGDPEAGARDHVLILDTSAWMAARGGKGVLMNEARASTLAYLRALPANDRLMLVRADALTTPATGFESSRRVLEQAVRDSRPSASALNLPQAFEFARQMQKLQSLRGGEIVYVGAGRIPSQEAWQPPAVAAVRLIPVSEPADNCGLRKIGVHRAPEDPAHWQISVGAHNYGRAAKTVQLALLFGGVPVGTRSMTLAPGKEESIGFQYRTRAAGWLEARLLTPDAFPDDDRATLEVPAERTLRVTVFSDDPDSLRPVLAANSRVQAVFERPLAYHAVETGIVVLDRFRPPRMPTVDSIWIDPPAEGSPIPVRTVQHDVALARWRTDHALAAGLRTKDLRLANTLVFAAAPGDIAIAETDAGPIILARPGKPKMVLLGFHPGRSEMRYELAAPLLFANTLRWMEPDLFRHWELSGGTVGDTSVTFEADADLAGLRVTADNQQSLPYTLEGRTLRFFTATPGTVRVQTGDREMVFSLTLPEMAEARWEAPKNIRRGVPPISTAGRTSRDLWQLLALLGAIGLFAEWHLYGRRRFAARLGAKTAGAAKGVLRKPWRVFARRAS
ncbi:MAG: VWA domain-containing protein, partial [Acidobacteria bacterium]|nr:VWA domain-containing protein [Acidobacteriota bacterium]